MDVTWMLFQCSLIRMDWALAPGHLKRRQCCMCAQLLLAPDDSDWGQGLSVQFDSGGGGHAVLLLRAGTFPTLLDQDFTFSAQEYVQGPQVGAPSSRASGGPLSTPVSLQPTRSRLLSRLKHSWLPRRCSTGMGAVPNEVTAAWCSPVGNLRARLSHTSPSGLQAAGR